MYASERDRRTARATSQSLDDHLLSLELTVCAERLSQANIMRAAQLLNKTNQMNLATRRMTEAQFFEWTGDERHQTFVFRVSDRFGEHGLTGIGTLSLNGSVAQVVDFVLSCRVMGRGVEEAMLHVLAEQAQREGATRLVATYVETERNAPCRAFFEDRSRLERTPDGSQYVWDLGRAYPAPSHVAVRYTSDVTPDRAIAGRVV
jgi:FkbH-like protein